MNKQDIEQMNEVIAAFEGRKKTHFNEAGKVKIYWSDPSGINPLYSDALYYHLSWDELMPVVEKIEATHHEFHGYFGVHISSNSCCIQGTKLRTDLGNEHYAYFNEVVHESKLLATYHCVYQFIVWYNENIKNQSGN